VSRECGSLGDGGIEKSSSLAVGKNKMNPKSFLEKLEDNENRGRKRKYENEEVRRGWVETRENRENGLTRSMTIILTR
jgi:hypothetical protein